MAISETDIANMALMKVGAKPKIDSLVEDSDNARLCNTFYRPMRDAVLRAHPWNCAEHRKIITQLSEAPAFGYDYQYQLPANPYCLRVLQVGEDDEQPTVWKVEGRRLLTDEGTSIKLKYIKRITDTNEFDPLLVDAISIKLASKLAMPLGNSQGLVDALVKELELITLPEARTIDGQESSGDELEVDTWMGSRY